MWHEDAKGTYTVAEKLKISQSLQRFGLLVSLLYCDSYDWMSTGGISHQVMR